jgi:organic radical activating enzyme
MSNNFCRLLSNGYKINVVVDQLLWSPCCFYSKKTPLSDKESFQKALKYSSSATGWLPECATCRQMEANGAIIPREDSNTKVPGNFDPGVCVALEISFDTECNAACLSCGGYFSSTWRKYDYKHKIHDYGPNINYADKLLQELIQQVDLSQVRDIFILGGEPFYTDTHIKLLKHLIATHPCVDQISLRYSSNGSVIPSEEAQELWTNFKQVIVSLSIDGIENKFNYLRWPLKWHRVERTIEYLLKNTTVKMAVNAVISPLNILRFDEVKTWAQNIIPNNRLSAFSKNPIRTGRAQGIIDLNVATVELRQAAIDQYGPDHKISKILDNLEFNHDHKPMFDYVNQHDQLRRLDWRKTFPEIVKYYPDA